MAFIIKFQTFKLLCSFVGRYQCVQHGITHLFSLRHICAFLCRFVRNKILGKAFRKQGCATGPPNHLPPLPPSGLPRSDRGALRAPRVLFEKIPMLAGQPSAGDGLGCLGATRQLIGKGNSFTPYHTQGVKPC